MDVNVSVNPFNRRGFALTFPYNPELLDKVKLCLDTKWNKDIKAWTSEGPEVLMDMRRFGVNIGWISSEARMHAESFHSELARSYEARAMTIGEEKWAFQKPGSAWLQCMTSAILGDEMGVGKSKQSIDASLQPPILDLASDAIEAGSRNVLIVTEKTLTFNWANEIEKWHPDWTYGVVPTDRRTRNRRVVDEETGEITLVRTPGRDEFWENAPNIVICNYEQLLREDWPYERDWDILICDEATRFKNRTTQIFNRIETLSKVVLSEDTWYTGSRHFWCLTGTPMEKAIYEFWNLFHLVRPGLLSNWWRFKEQHVTTDDDGKIVGLKNLGLLHERVGYFMLRRTRKEVMPWLPGKLYNNALIEMSAGERTAYDSFKRTFNNWLTDHNVSGGSNPMTQTLRARQFCCSPWLFGTDLGFGSKYEMLYDVLDQWSGHVVVFSFFKEMTRLLQDWYDTDPRAYIDGDVGAQERFRRVEDFNAGRLGKVFISTDAGGRGLNIPGADLIVHYDQGNFNSARLLQREDRLAREGQEADHIQVLNMLMLDSIDVGMYQLAREEEAMAHQVVDGAEEYMVSRINAARWRQVMEGRLNNEDGRNLAT